MLRVIDFYWMFYVKNDGFLLNFKLIDLNFIFNSIFNKISIKKIKKYSKF